MYPANPRAAKLTFFSKWDVKKFDQDPEYWQGAHW